MKQANIKYSSEELAVKSRIINDMIQELYKENQQITPLFPWVLLRVCKKEQQIGSIVLPDSVQNKTLHEGIVVVTWQPCDRVIEGVTNHYSSELKQGDHVLFNHYAGVPIDGRHSGYRLVKEVAWAVDKEGGIIATVDYDTRETRPVEKLRAIILDNVYFDDPEEVDLEDIEELIKVVKEQFLLVDLNTPSVTLSGR